MANEEHDPNSAEPTPVAQAAVSQSQGAPISPDGLTSEKLLHDPAFQEGLSRLMQSEKDREINRLKKKLAEVEAVIGKTTEPQKETETPASVSSVSQPEVSISQALRNAGVDASDKLAYEALQQSKQGLTQNQLESWLIEQRHTRQSTSASPASATQAGGGIASQGQSPEDLVAEYTKSVVAARGNATAVREIQAKYRNLGVPVEQIGFK